MAGRKPRERTNEGSPSSKDHFHLARWIIRSAKRKKARFEEVEWFRPGSRSFLPWDYSNALGISLEKSNDEVFSRGVILTKISSMSKYFEDLSCHSWFTSLLTIRFVCSCFSNLREATACKEINGEKKILFSDYNDCFAFFDCEWN